MSISDDTVRVHQTFLCSRTKNLHMVVLYFYFSCIYFILEMIDRTRFQVKVLQLENSYCCESRFVWRKLTKRQKKWLLCYYEAINWYNSGTALESSAVATWRIEGQIGGCHRRGKGYSLSKGKGSSYSGLLFTSLL